MTPHERIRQLNITMSYIKWAIEEIDAVAIPRDDAGSTYIAAAKAVLNTVT